MSIEQLRRATLDARRRTGDTCISTRAEGGRVQIVRTVPQEGGSFEVLALSGWLPVDAAGDALAAL